MTYRSSAVCSEDNRSANAVRGTIISPLLAPLIEASTEATRYIVEGELTVHGVTRPVPLLVEVNGFGPDPFGGTRAGWSARTQIDRRDFGIQTNMPRDGGGVVIGDKVEINIEVEATEEPGGLAVTD
jgi:hypothetical protein